MNITRSFLNFYQSVETIVNGLVSLVVNIFMFAISQLAPVAAPIPPAFSIYTAMTERLNVPQYIAIIAAIAIEIVGIFTAKVAIRSHQWNATRTKAEPVSPHQLAVAMAAVFFAVVLILSLTIELWPNLALWVYPGFVMVAITVYVNLAINNNLTEWNRERAERLSLAAEKRGINSDIKQAQISLASVKNQAEEMTQNVAKLTNERDTLTADIDRQRAKLTRLTTANKPDNAPNNHVLAQTTAERLTLIDLANATRKDQIDTRHQAIVEIKNNEPGLSQPDLTNRLNKLGFKVSLSTVKRDIKSLNGSLQVQGVK